MVIRQATIGSIHVGALVGSPRGRRLSRASTIAIGASIAVHAVVGIYLYNAVFRIPLHTPEQGPVLITDIFRPLHPEPKPPASTPTHRNNLHPPVDKGLATPDPFPVDPPKTRPLGETTTSGPLATAEEPLKLVTIDPPPGPRRISNPDWLSRPDARAMSAMFPGRAINMGVSGGATISCVVSATGSVGQCTVIKESPADFGFGAAALKLSKYFRMRPRTEDDQPVDGAIVQIPIKFQIANG